uniref:Uncharacterized protein n=1 Tax=viral metagenome TaxID=1070528 RepID=A0A6C0DT68_9ZZZZ
MPFWSTSALPPRPPSNNDNYTIAISPRCKTQQITISTETYDILLARLKWLETPECRQCMEEEKRIAVRKEITERFRKVLQTQAVFANLHGSTMMVSLYN